MKHHSLPSLAVVLLLLGGCDSPRTDDDAGRVVRRDAALVECAPPGSRGVSERCGCSADCASGLLCNAETAEGYPGGACIGVCDPDDALACGPDGSCITYTSGATVGTCARSCTSRDECGRGRVCDGATCFLYCQSDDDCDNGRCDRYSGLCRPPADGLGLNAQCLTDDECRSDSCNSQGRCISLCSLMRQGCPDDAACIGGEGVGGDLGVCATRCMVDSECAHELVCRTTMTTIGTVRVCALR